MTVAVFKHEMDERIDDSSNDHHLIGVGGDESALIAASIDKQPMHLFNMAFTNCDYTIFTV